MTESRLSCHHALKYFKIIKTCYRRWKKKETLEAKEAQLEETISKWTPVDVYSVWPLELKFNPQAGLRWVY